MSKPASQPTRRSRRWIVVAAIAVGALGGVGALLASGCAEQLPFLPSAGDASSQPEDTDGCLTQTDAPTTLPNVKAEHETLAYWLARSPQPTQVLLSAGDIADHNQAFAEHACQHPAAELRRDLLAPVDAEALRKELKERLGYLHERAADGRYRDAKGKRLDDKALALLSPASALPPVKEQWRVVLAPLPLRCGPGLAPLYKAPQFDKSFDRNGCSTLRTQELVRVLASWPNGTQLVRSSYSIGWVAADAPLSAPLTREQAQPFASRSKWRLDKAQTIAGQSLPQHTLLPRADDGVWVATPKAVEKAPLAVAQGSSVARPLTRQQLLTTAFEYLGSPYGWSGQGGGRDCSRLLMDVFDSFGLELPRHSGGQARAGSMSVDVSSLKNRSQRLAVVDAAHQQGVVLLHFPGHIMLYLGRNDEGQPMALHAFAEYLTHCDQGSGYAGKPETMRRVDRVRVSDLLLGEGTSRGAFVDRITRVTLFGAAPGPALQALVERRPSAPVSAEGACKLPEEMGMLVMPRRPHPGEPVRVVVSSEEDIGPANLTLFGPNGQRVTPKLKRSGGPPYGYVAELSAPTVGEWQARLGDGDNTAACQAFTVYEKGPYLQGGGGAVWIPRKRWSRSTENLFAVFVEQLFHYPLDDRTWPNLQELLRNRENNLLFNYLGQGEETRLALRPDCADLPYFLRAYFAWKLRLPFAYRHCNRGSVGKAPYCDRDLHSNLAKRESSGETSAFGEFATRNIADGVHSGSGRTGPNDNNSDYYPVGLTRSAIRPGTMFADPYGHLFVIAGWIPQGTDNYGVLVGADAQPDGTVGRRRFWRGSFLFSPNTTEAGAGFKAFRPARYRGGRIRQLRNQQLGADSGFTPYSRQQYEGSVDAFYDRIEAMINPRPLEPAAMQEVLVTALYEQVKRRVVSVDNGEQYKATHRAAVKMPRGHSIFETTGAWENFSTPSRDMRLLIAMDTVMGFVASVRRQPARFGLSAANVDAAIAKLVKSRDSSLADKALSYKRSDGATQTLTLADVVKRAPLFEMAYNPNDCIEIRWAAAPDSAEAKSCKRHAPAHQRRLMTRYRSWFAERKRPAR